MRTFNQYDLIVCDIDDTLIYGFWTDLMHHTWNLFRSDTLSSVLMFLQEKFKLYKVNMPLLYRLLNCEVPVVFLTVRRTCPSTLRMLYDIMSPHKFSLIELGTDLGIQQKAEVVENYLSHFPDILFIDDNKAIRDNVEGLEVDTLDPVLLRDKEFYI